MKSKWQILKNSVVSDLPPIQENITSFADVVKAVTMKLKEELHTDHLDTTLEIHMGEDEDPNPTNSEGGSSGGASTGDGGPSRCAPVVKTGRRIAVVDRPLPRQTRAVWPQGPHTALGVPPCSRLTEARAAATDRRCDDGRRAYVCEVLVPQDRAQ